MTDADHTPRPALAGSPIDLAVFRIAVAFVLLTSAQVYAAPAFAADATTAHVARAALYLGATAGLVGVFARIGFAVAALAGFYLLGLPHAAGVGLHTHHLVWFAALLACSPCADTLAPGRLRAPMPSMAYGMPIRAAWLILAAIFFWPGVHKLLDVGPAWFTGEHLRGQLYWKWAQSWDFAPLYRIDHSPALLAAGATATLIFELGFPLLLLSRRTRWSALFGALLFHAATAVFMDIHFSSLWPCHAALVPWHRWLGRWLPSDDSMPSKSLPSVSLGLIGALVLAVWIAGARGETRGWPFACYPTFTTPAPSTMPTLVIEANGDAIALSDIAPPSSTLWAEIWRLIGIGGPVDPAALEAFWLRHRGPPDGPLELRFYRAEQPVDPDHRGPPRALHLLHTARWPR